MDGFVLTHAYERMDIPTQEQVDAYLPPYDPRQKLDVNHPVSIGAMVGPKALPKFATCSITILLKLFKPLKKLRRLLKRPSAANPVVC